jgi:hypothetical protein
MPQNYCAAGWICGLQGGFIGLKLCDITQFEAAFRNATKDLAKNNLPKPVGHVDRGAVCNRDQSEVCVLVMPSRA